MNLSLKQLVFEYPNCSLQNYNESLYPFQDYILKKQNIELKGYASSLKDIMFFLNKLEEAKHFKSPNLISIGSEHVEPERDGLTSFTIEALRI